MIGFSTPNSSSIHAISRIRSFVLLKIGGWSATPPPP
jgi:hypothetical protein